MLWRFFTFKNWFNSYTMAPGRRSLYFQFPLLLLMLISFRLKLAASNVCDLANLTVVNSTQESWQRHALTVERSSVVTFACWTWCGYVDWFTITPTGERVPFTGVNQFNCTSKNGSCHSFRGIPDCTNVQPGQGSRLKYELSLLANETFYIDCRPQCPFGKDNNKQEGRTNGLLVFVVDPPEPSQVTPTRSATVTSSPLCSKPTQTMSSLPSSSSSISTVTATSSFGTQTTSLSVSTVDLTSSTTSTSQLQTTALPARVLMASQTANAVRTETISFLAVAVVSSVLFTIMLVLFSILLIFYINAKRRIVDLKLQHEQQQPSTKEAEISQP